MTTYTAGLSTDQKSVFVITSGGTLPVGATGIGSFDHDESDDELGALASGHAIFHHIRDLLYKTSHADPSEAASYPDGIYNMAEIAILLAWAATNTVLPAITGTAQVGQVLTTTNGTWNGTPAPTYTRQWKANGVAIVGATGTTYTPVVGDIGKTITCTITATNTAGATTATSAATAAVIAA
jgi:hypothetical protein